MLISLSWPGQLLLWLCILAMTLSCTAACGKKFDESDRRRYDYHKQKCRFIIQQRSANLARRAVEHPDSQAARRARLLPPNVALTRRDRLLV